MISSKPGASHLNAVLKEKDIRYIVICPGSRNAPLILSFTADPFFTCFSLVDERSAGFFALGLCQKTKHTVAIICTSGSALLNIGPAVAEAYYQRLPLLVISADRPAEWVNQGESQTMLQNNVFENFTRGNFDLIQEPDSDEALWFQDRQINEAVNATLFPYFGPVHINIRFHEPLYEKSEIQIKPSSLIHESRLSGSLSAEDSFHLLKSWRLKNRILIICGQMFPDEELKKILRLLSGNGIVVLTESTSNMGDESFIPYIDKIIVPASEKIKAELKPDLLITLGGPMVSRKIKTMLRSLKDFEHWHTDALDPYLDAYGRQNQAIRLPAADFLRIFTAEEKKPGTYLNLWKKCLGEVDKRHETYMSKVEFSDLKAFDLILSEIPEQSVLQIGNSSAIRYVQLFNKCRQLSFFSNRGTSGIEGCVSTCVGYSVLNPGLTFLIAGDLSVFYDSNGFWNKYLSPRLKIIVLNNGGGGIFRIIDGPSSIPQFEEFVESKHNLNFEKLSHLHNLSYFKVENEMGFSGTWQNFISENQRPALLEIYTAGIENDKVLLNYFEHLKFS